jgi:hypothetical protein
MAQLSKELYVDGALIKSVLMANFGAKARTDVSIFILFINSEVFCIGK